MVAPDTCANCGVPLAGAWCHACGQRAPYPGELRLGRLAREAARRAATLDSRTLRSLAGLFRPGFLTAEYLAGRRVPYLSPIKLYLVSAAIFFLAAPVAGFTLEGLTARPGMDFLIALAESRREAVGMAPEHFAERFDLRLQTVYTVMLAVSVIAAALFLALLYRRQRVPFGAHVVFSLHYVGFLYFGALVLGTLSPMYQHRPLVAVAVTYCVIAPYLVIALRRVYREPLGRTVLKMVALTIMSLVVDTAVNTAALLLTLRLV